MQTARSVRSAITAVHYLLERTQASRWHIVQSDDIWHFYQGSPLVLLAYDRRSARACATCLEIPRTIISASVIPNGVWQAARSLGDFSLVGCSVGPGFEFEDFSFVANFPQHRMHFEDELAAFASLL